MMEGRVVSSNSGTIVLPSESTENGGSKKDMELGKKSKKFSDVLSLSSTSLSYIRVVCFISNSLFFQHWRDEITKKWKLNYTKENVLMFYQVT